MVTSILELSKSYNIAKNRQRKDFKAEKKETDMKGEQRAEED